ncbi:hypothetical protein E4T56_gene4603 [Termitomyces sp. T112]|nr:hypothetical protein E4T56_gene4603 [Termitomyces sp. T112]
MHSSSLRPQHHTVFSTSKCLVLDIYPFSKVVNSKELFMSTITPNQANGNSNSSRTFLSALVLNVVLLVIEVGAFVVLKQRFDRIYSPRTRLPPPNKRAVKLPTGPWKWIPAVILSPTEDIIHKNGLDAYMFLRFLKMIMWIFLVFTVLTFVVIIPVLAANVKDSQRGLDRISWNNIIDPHDQPRLGAHVGVVYILTFFVIYLIRHEMLHFVHVRHQFLISQSHSRLAQARTVLITSVPDEIATEHDLRTFASFVPGGVDNVWILRDHSTLNKLFRERQDICTKLEAAIASLLAKATKMWRRREKTLHRACRSKSQDSEDANSVFRAHTASRELLNELVPPAHRPRHRVGVLGLFGNKVDTINWCKDEIVRLNKRIEEERANFVGGKSLGSAFIRCNLQIGAHVLAQCLSYHEPLKMYDKWMEANPKDVVWENLDDGSLEMRSRYIISWLATIGLIVAWSFPAAFIGTLSNLDDLCSKIQWLGWVCKAPNPIPGIIQGILPPALLAVLFAFLPLILRAFAWYECIPRYSLISVSVYKRFFLFLLVHGFLIVTLSSGITKAIEGIIARPTETVQELARQLPGASIFFLTYIITQGLAGAGGALVQLVPLILHFIKKQFLGRTPRQAYEVTFLMPSADFGIILPRLSLLVTIAFAYSVLSPLINLLALISFGMFYLAWKFLLLQVFDQPDHLETGGLYFPMAISNLFVGLYIEQICLACLFFLKVNNDRAPAIAEGVLMILLIVVTMVAQILMKHSFNPLISYLPMSLATKKMAKRYAKQKEEHQGTADDEIDMFSRQQIKSIRKRFAKATQKIDARLRTEVHEVIRGPTSEQMKGESENMKAQQDFMSTEIADKDICLEGLPKLFLATSRESQTSRKSKSSKGSEGHSVFEPDAPATISLVDDSDEEEEDDHAFNHPSTYVEQPWIWIPADKLGLSVILKGDLISAGVNADDLGAFMDWKGTVDVKRNPPDEEWQGGHDN